MIFNMLLVFDIVSWLPQAGGSELGQAVQDAIQQLVGAGWTPSLEPAASLVVASLEVGIDRRPECACEVLHSLTCQYQVS